MHNPHQHKTMHMQTLILNLSCFPQSKCRGRYLMVYRTTHRQWRNGTRDTNSCPTWNGAPHVPAPMADNAQRTLYTTLEFSRRPCLISHGTLPVALCEHFLQQPPPSQFCSGPNTSRGRNRGLPLALLHHKHCRASMNNCETQGSHLGS